LRRAEKEGVVEIVRDKGGRHRINGILVGDLGEVPGAVRALKKPIPITVRRVDEPFTVETTEGVMTGRAGDWLMQGVAGEWYICPAEIFAKSYDVLGALPAAGASVPQPLTQRRGSDGKDLC
jgi:hypothetical protein